MKNEDLTNQVFGKEAQGILDELKTLDPEVAELVSEIAIGKIWSRPGLTLKERSMITIASQISMGRWDQVERHMKGFLHRGGTEKELKEIAIHLSIYCGFPAMLSGFQVLKKIISG